MWTKPVLRFEQQQLENGCLVSFENRIVFTEKRRESKRHWIVVWYSRAVQGQASPTDC